MMLYIDFETYFDKEYSLSKMPTAQYVRDERFKILGVAVAYDDEQPLFINDINNIREFFANVNWRSAYCIAHNAAFDGFILNALFDHRPARWFDTMLLARWAISQGHLSSRTTTSLAALADVIGLAKGDTAKAVAAGGEDLASYAINDIVITREIFKHLLAFKPPVFELDIIDLHIRMATEPVFHLDKPLLEKASIYTPETEQLHKLLRKDKNFVQLLDKLKVKVEYKTTPTGRERPALAKTDEFVNKLTRHSNPVVAALATARLEAQSNITRTRAQRFLDVGEPFPAPLLYYGAITGRSAGADRLNVQNLPRGGVLRRALIAPPGHTLVVGDSKQIEVRVLAWAAKDEHLRAVLQDSDPYRLFASEHMFRVPFDEVTPEQRRIAKSAVLGLGFGQRPTGFMAYCARFGIDISIDDAEKAFNAYHNAFLRIQRFWHYVERRVKAVGGFELPSGRKLRYPALRRGDVGGLEYARAAIFSRAKGVTFEHLWYGKLVENVVQAIARDVLYWQALQLQKAAYKIALVVHDEIVIVVDKNILDKAHFDMVRCLSTTPPWAEGLNLAGEVGIARSYGEAK
jgi:DNA polymerase